MPVRAHPLTVLLLSGALGCSSSDGGESGFSAEEVRIIESLSPLPSAPDDPTNEYSDDPAAAELGQLLFNETSYSGALAIGDDGENGATGEQGETGTVACASCHIPEEDFYDKRSKPGNVSLGTEYTTRNAPSLVNAVFYDFHGWGGNRDSMWAQAILSLESTNNTGGNRCGYAHMMFEEYRDEYDAIFDEPLPEGLGTGQFPESCKPKQVDAEDGAWEGMSQEDQEAINGIMANSGKAIAAFERLLVSGDSAFDQFVAGDTSALSASAQRGLELFIGKAACVDCHSGPSFSDNEYYNTGVPQEGPNVPEVDQGRFEDLPLAKSHQFNGGSIYSDDPEYGQAKLDAVDVENDDLGAFRTESLRNVANTAPYMHTGAFETLEEVVQFYSEGGADSGFVGEKSPKQQSLDLSAAEQADLVEFLRSLTGEPLPDRLTAVP